MTTGGRGRRSSRARDTGLVGDRLGLRTDLLLLRPSRPGAQQAIRLAATVAPPPDELALRARMTPSHLHVWADAARDEPTSDRPRGRVAAALDHARYGERSSPPRTLACPSRGSRTRRLSYRRRAREARRGSASSASRRRAERSSRAGLGHSPRFARRISSTVFESLSSSATGCGCGCGCGCGLGTWGLAPASSLAATVSTWEVLPRSARSPARRARAPRSHALLTRLTHDEVSMRPRSDDTRDVPFLVRLQKEPGPLPSESAGAGHRGGGGVMRAQGASSSRHGLGGPRGGPRMTP